MDLYSLLMELSRVWWLIALLVLIASFNLPRIKGVIGETLVRILAMISLPSDRYHAFHNITLPTLDGTTQIDHIFVSRFGIFVVETKNMRGWIFGGERQAQWTQKFFRKSYKFQNPLRQNYKHTKALEALLNVSPASIHSVVVFFGKNTFKTLMPSNITRGGSFIRYIKSFQEPLLSEPEVESITVKLRTVYRERTWRTHRAHVKQLQLRADPNAERKCPRCGNPLLLRTAKRGENAGKQFWGCSAYPRCRTIQNFPD